MSRPVLKPEEKQADHNHGYASAMAKAAEQYKRAMQDEKSREQWIENYLPLVKSIVGRLRHHFPESYQTEDMYGIGARALVIAVNKFDPGKGKAFGNYATLRIKGALLDELRKIDSLLVQIELKLDPYRRRFPLSKQNTNGLHRLKKPEQNLVYP